MYANLQLQTQLAQQQMAILENLQASMTQLAPGKESKNSSLPALSRNLLLSHLPQFSHGSVYHACIIYFNFSMRTISKSFYWICYNLAWVCLFCGLEACGTLTPWPGIELQPPALKHKSLNHWTAREAPVLHEFRASCWNLEGLSYLAFRHLYS